MSFELSKVCIPRKSGFSYVDLRTVTTFTIHSPSTVEVYYGNDRSFYFELVFTQNIAERADRDSARDIIVVCLLGLYPYPERIFKNYGKFKQLKQIFDLIPYDMVVLDEDQVSEVNQFLEALFNRPELGYETE